MTERMTDLELTQPDHHEITTLTAEIVGAYVAHHTVAANDLPDLIQAVGKELAGLSQSPAEPEEEKPTPAVPIKRSVTPDHIICLEDGKKLKMLKRHLKTRYDLKGLSIIYPRFWKMRSSFILASSATLAGIRHLPIDSTLIYRAVACAAGSLPTI